MHHVFAIALVVFSVASGGSARGELSAGAAVVDVTPEQLPVLVNGGMLGREADTVKTPLSARSLVLDDGEDRLAIVVVDSCMMPRALLDEAKAAAAAQTGIPADRILISATHTHSAPSSMACLGTEADPSYVPFLRRKLVEAIAGAAGNLEPARVGWGVVDAGEYTALRRWIRRPDRLADDPFGNPTLRANMHAASNWDDVTGESGPEDPDLSLIALQSADGRPLAVLANFSMHYFGDQSLSADYFGLFCEGLKSRLAGESEAEGEGPPFVGIMSHGCSGDIYRVDYAKPPGSRGEDLTIQSYADALVDRAVGAYESIEFRADADLEMAEARVPLRYRVPDAQRLDWARRVVEAMGDRPPKDTTEVYAREQLILHEWQSTEVVVQAIKIGELAIATTPTETYALTGLKIKLQSPLEKTMVIELANGGDGYIPPPEQHLLGGYNTWAARSAGLEVQAEPKIVEAALGLLEDVSGCDRAEYRQPVGPASEAIRSLRPAAYWRLDEFSGPRAIDHVNDHDAFYEPGVAFFLEGPRPDAFSPGGRPNRSAHLAGGRIDARIPGLGDRYSVSLWCWNGMPEGARDVSGWLFARGHDRDRDGGNDRLGVGGTGEAQGRLIFSPGGPAGGDRPLVGRTAIERWTWHHVVLVRDGDSVRIHLDGDPEPEIEAPAVAGSAPRLDQIFLGGRCDGDSTWEGRLDEIAVFDRVLTVEEIERLSPR
ncbi:LamG-like jellyroll fold domain-containing protein [Tautonia plasticadhaerens]|uniref:Neutral/alkaline non-lysosomal ceramidase n=1 Tax=Tautonia plasticadhaerens TaxID=2527974 RepID=A0A518H6S7_9BACT|nr:LamG-like jellyroll fold domain-containing protein [Tautonia plasticadhaerens]QDV36523.1 Neutral/alkaline non-lysosomal ceramidase [Tautonia plasticadhaerens]